jgi:hypothetical protein
MDRAFGMLLARGLGTHWMEMYANWFREKAILNLIRSQIDFYRSLPEKPQGTTPVEVCFVSDAESAFYAQNNKGDGIHQLLINDLFRRVNEAGFAYRHVLLPDILEKGLIPPHKLYVITNLLTLRKEQRKQLWERFISENATVIWLYGPGIFYPDNGPSTQNISSLLGLKFEQINEKLSPEIKMLDGNNSIKPTNSRTINSAPWFLPVSGFEKVIARTNDGKPAIVEWKKDALTNYFSAVPNLSPEMLREIASKAGVEIFCRTGDPVHVGNDFIVLHAKTGGEKLIDIPEGMHLKSVIGPLKSILKPGEKFSAVPGRTYGFQLIKD